MTVQLEPRIVVCARLAQQREDRGAVLVVRGLMWLELQAAFDQAQCVDELLAAGEVDRHPREPRDIHTPHCGSVGKPGTAAPQSLQGLFPRQPGQVEPVAIEEQHDLLGS